MSRGPGALTFPEALVREPVLARLVRHFDVEPNIRRADVEEHRGWIVCELEGEAGGRRGRPGLAAEEGVQVDLLGDVLEG